MEYIINALPLLLSGAVITLLITVIGILIGSIIGLFMSLAKLSANKLISFFATAYIDFFRGTPLLVQIMIIYFGIPNLLMLMHEQWVAYVGIPIAEKFTMDVWMAAIISISLNSAAYIAEIFRAGIQSIDKGQVEAAYSLGMNRVQVLYHVILPQAFRRIIPPMGNEFIMLLKDTSLLSIIGFEELARKTQLEVARTYATFELWMACAFIYLVMTIIFSRLLSMLEERLKTDKNGEKIGV